MVTCFNALVRINAEALESGMDYTIFHKEILRPYGKEIWPWLHLLHM